MTTPNLDYLGVPMTLLPYLHDLDDFPGIPPEGIELLRGDYSAEQFQAIVEAMQFVIANPEMDLFSKMPGLRHSNEQIYAYLAKFLQSVYEADGQGAPAEAAAPAMPAPPPAPVASRPMPAPPPAVPAKPAVAAKPASPAFGDRPAAPGAARPVQPRFGAR